MKCTDLARALRAVVDLKLDENTRAGDADAATLENAIEILEQEPLRCDGAQVIYATWSQGQRKKGIAQHCAGAVIERVCADCGYTVRRCEAHGSTRSVSRTMHLHRVAHHHAHHHERSER